MTAERPRRERRPHDKVARIVRSATALFGVEGYSRARIDVICRDAGVSVGTFYDNFENKSDLVLHIAELALEGPSFPAVRTSAELEDEVARILESPVSGVVRAWLEAVALEPELRAPHSRMRAAHIAQFTEWVRAARAASGSAPGLTDAITARAVIALLKEANIATYEPANDRAAATARAIWFLVHGAV